MSLRMHVRTKGGKKKVFFERSLATTVSVEEKKSIYPAGGCRCHFVLIPGVTIKKYVYRLRSSLDTKCFAESIARPTKDLYLCLIKYLERPAPL